MHYCVTVSSRHSFLLHNYTFLLTVYDIRTPNVDIFLSIYADVCTPINPTSINPTPINCTNPTPTNPSPINLTPINPTPTNCSPPPQVASRRAPWQRVEVALEESPTTSPISLTESLANSWTS